MCCTCHLSSAVEQHFCKVKVLGSNPRGGSREEKYKLRIPNYHNVLTEEVDGHSGELFLPATNLQQRTLQFRRDIIRFSCKLHQSIASREIARQLVRSGTSIGANLIEGKGGSSKRDFINFLYIARKSAYETAYWLELTREFQASLDILEPLLTECQALTKILTTIILNTQRKAAYLSS